MRSNHGLLPTARMASVVSSALSARRRQSSSVRLTPLAELQTLRDIEAPAANAPADAVPSRFGIVVRTAKVDDWTLLVPGPRNQQEILCKPNVERQPCAEHLAVQCFSPHSEESANKTLMTSTGAGLLCLMGSCFDHISCGFEFYTGHAPVLA